MKFWLKRPGSTDFNGPMTLDEIREQIQTGSITWDYEVLEAAAQSLGALKRSTDWVALTEVCSQESLPVVQVQDISYDKEQSPVAFLDNVRRRTCYSALRDIIGLFAVLSIIVIVILAGFYVFLGVNTKNALSIAIGVVVVVLGCFLVIASKQASLLLVDIADILIEQNRNKTRGNAE